MQQTPVDEGRSGSISGDIRPETEGAWDRHLEGIRVLFGVGALAELGAVVTDLGGKRVLLVADPGITAAGHSEAALTALEAAGAEALLFDAVDENPTDDNVADGALAARQHRADFLVGLGGGSAMDCAKGINFLLSAGGEMAQYEGFGHAGAKMLGSVGIPTTAGTGSEAQSYALITSVSTHRKMPCGDPRARFQAVILDPSLTDSLPPRTAAAAALDAVSHALESFVARTRTAASAGLALNAWRLLEPHLLGALRSPGDHRAWGSMQLGAFLAGAAIERSMLGAAHALANPLTATYGTTHGVAVSLMLPNVVRFNGPSATELYAELEPTADDPAEALAAHFERLRSAAGLPATLRDSGIPEEAGLADLAAQAAQQWTLRFNPRQASVADLIDLYERTF